MLIYCPGQDIFQSPAQTLVNPVNTVGVMGNGLAKQFKLRYPLMFRRYQTACRTDVFKIHGFMVWAESEKRKVLCFPTKRDWKNYSRLEWIEAGLERLAQDYKRYNIKSLAIPALGCGKGQVNGDGKRGNNFTWEQVDALIKFYFEKLDIDVYVYPPQE